MTKSTKTSIALAILSALFFLPFLGGVHLFDWDEINFAEIAREMIVLDEYFRPFINYQPFWEKPPLFIWFQVLAMKAFGVGEYAARFPNAICGIITIVLIYQLGKKMYNHQFGLVWAFSYLGSVLPFLYFKSGIIDPWFNLFIFLGIYYFIQFHWKKNGYNIELSYSARTYLILAGLCIGLGILTKGPVAYLIAALTFGVYWVYQKFKFYVSVPEFLLYTLTGLLVTGLWFGLETMRNGTWFAEQFIRYQAELFNSSVAGHKGFPGYHFVVLLLGCFPASIFCFASFWHNPSQRMDYQADFRRWMIYLFWVVLILFSLVQSKIVHYSSLAYFPLTFLAALYLNDWMDGKVIMSKLVRFGLISIAILYGLIILALPIIGSKTEWLISLLNDPFAIGNLQAEVQWDLSQMLPAVFLFVVVAVFFGLIRKQKRWQSIISLYLGMGIFIFFTLVSFIKRVEGYSQRAAITFYESKQDEDCYIITHAFKSYAHLFYQRKPAVTNSNSFDKTWLMEGHIDKDVYIVSKVHRAHQLEAYPDVKEIYRENGFVFFHRPVPN